MDPERQRAKVTVVGAGIIGLAVAFTLPATEYEVTVVARDLPGDDSVHWASPWAGALLSPHPDAAARDLQLSSIRVYQRLVDDKPEAGVQRIKVCEFYDDRQEDANIWYEPFMPGFSRMAASERPAGTTLGFTYTGMVVSPATILPWLMKELESRRVPILRRRLSSLQEAKELTGAKLVVNASGLGAAALVGDDNVHAVRGQTMFIKTNDCSQVVIRQGSEYTYMIPRPYEGGVILGGVTQIEDTRAAPDVALRADILQRVNAMTNGAFEWVDLGPDVARDIVGFRPARKGGLRLEREGDVVHAYGVGALGYVYAFGVAQRVVELVSEGSLAHL